MVLEFIQSNIKEFLSQIPEDKQIIIQGGNHDSMRIAEPQPFLNKNHAKNLWSLKNVTMVTNPALVRVHREDKYEGLKVLMYHGYSFNYYLDKIEGLRLAGGYERPDKVIEYLLKHRHLAPAYKSTLALPMKEDPLIIYEVPDVLATGHIHKAAIAKYKNTFTISASCWQNNTSFQDKVGLKADPAKVPILNLKTGKASILDFN
jgi:DNA polymerase II small subunit